MKNEVSTGCHSSYFLGGLGLCPVLRPVQVVVVVVEVEVEVEVEERTD